MIIRKANLKDVTQIKQIITDSYHENYAAAGEFYSLQQMVDPNYATQTGPYYNREIFVEDMIRELDEKFNEPFEIFVACENDNILGLITIENNNGRFWINNIFVKKIRKEAV